MKIVITGGLGYIGTELCKLYSGEARFKEIIVIDNIFASERVSQLRNWGINFIHGDILDLPLIKDVLKELLENIQLRIDSDKNFYVRLKLSKLVKGEISLADRDTISSTVKGKFKIESYPGDSTIDVISNLIKELI